MPSVPGVVVEYNVTNTATGKTVNLDGYAYWSAKHKLPEATKGYESLYQASDRHGFPVKADASMAYQVARPTGIAGTNPVE